MNTPRLSLLCLLCSGSLFLGSAIVNQNPRSAGTSLGRNVSGTTFEAAYHNPALLGLDRPPTGGVLFIPVTNYSIGYWSNKLALSPFHNYFGDAEQTVDNLLQRSFDFSGSPSQAADRVKNQLKGGADIYAGTRIGLFNHTNNFYAIDVTTGFDEALHIPEGALYLPISFERGDNYDFSSFRQTGVWATTISLQLGLPVTIPQLHKIFKLDYGAGGFGVKYIMGHSVLKADAPEGSLYYNEQTNELDVNTEIHILTAGSGIHGNLDRFENPFKNGLPINGHGIGMDIGGILYDEKSALSINFSNIGVLLWMNDVREATYPIRKSDLDLFDIVDGVQKADGDSATFVIFNRDLNEYFPSAADSLTPTSGFAMFTPFSINIGYSRMWTLKYSSKKRMRLLTEYVTAAANYKQNLNRWPGTSFIPRLSLGGELGALRGYLPLRMGFVLGGSERFASSLGMSLNFKYFSINGAYKAVGTPWFQPSKGVELIGGLNINWGMRMDADKDGIRDRDDKCPKEPEDKDKFEDEDGCPDLDNDGDGIPDTKDGCPNIPEDADGFEDDDGCPEADNDGDGIVDSLDECIDTPEDRDNFEDDDGCPDFDNDNDNVPDSTDKCPNRAEDIDGFEDEDGCPEFDNDKDGIPDSTDQCISTKEVFNGFEDNDGCPDSVPKPTEKEEKKMKMHLSGVNFKTGSAELTPSSFTHLNFIVNLLQQYPYLRYEIQGHTDSRGSDEYNLLLSAARANSVKNYLLQKGIDDSSVIAIGYGETRPVADNKTARGRALNRRVEFRQIETKQEYEQLREKAADFRRRVQEAKIEGANYDIER
jgi:outer membrane protein OmpA-like peptidoglycan-associated protein